MVVCYEYGMHAWSVASMIGMCMAAKEHPRLTRRRKQACEGGICECVLLLQSVWRAHASNTLCMHWLAATHACVAATCVDACDAMLCVPI